MDKFYKKYIQFKNTFWFDIVCWLWVGGLSALAYVPLRITYLIWIAPFGLFWIEKKYRGNWKKLFWNGYFFGIAFCTISFHWIISLLKVFGGFPLFIATPLFLLYVFATTQKFAVFLILFSFLRKKITKYGPWVAAFSGLVSEFFSYQLFPWYWGNIVAGHKFLDQTVEYVSVYGLSALLFYISYSLYQFRLFKQLNRPPVKLKNYARFFTLPVIVLIIFNATGIYLYYKWEAVKPSSTLRVLMIQPDSPLEFRDGRFEENMSSLMQKIDDLIIMGAEKGVDLIVLPESGIPFYSTHLNEATFRSKTYWEKFESASFVWSNRFKSNVFLNEIDASFKDDNPTFKNLRLYNSAVLFDPNGTRGESYHKSYLLAFGEYLPFGEEFPILYDLIPQVGHFVPGKRNNLIPYYSYSIQDIKPFPKPHLDWGEISKMSVEEVKKYYSETKTPVTRAGNFLPLICYEVIIPEFVRKFHNSGKYDYIVNITNDKWYGDSIESYEHLEQARLRAIEHRKWMVRSTNSGTSAYIDHLGRVVNDKFTGILTKDFYESQIEVIDSEPTFYVKYGNILPWIFIIISSGFFIYYILKKK